MCHLNHLVGLVVIVTDTGGIEHGAQHGRGANLAD
jgi:hypothetical protein